MINAIFLGYIYHLKFHKYWYDTIKNMIVNLKWLNLFLNVEW